MRPRRAYVRYGLETMLPGERRMIPLGGISAARRQVLVLSSAARLYKRLGHWYTTTQMTTGVRVTRVA